MTFLAPTTGLPWRKRETASVRCLIALWISLCIPTFAPGDDDVIRVKFLQQYQPHAESIQQYYSNIHVKYTSTSDHGNGKAQVTTVHDPTSEPPLCRLVVPFADPERKKSFLDIAHDEKTEFIDFKDCVWRDKPMKELKVRFPRIHPVSRQQINVLVSYYFSPADGWVCCGRRFYARKDPTYREDIYYYGPKNGEEYPVLKRTEEWRRSTQDPGDSRCRVRTAITEFRRASSPFPDSDFRLSAFGLPEPPGIEWEKPTPWYLWLGLAGIVCLVSGVGFRWLRRRKAGNA